MDVLGVVKKGIKRSNEKREFEQLVRKLNKEVKSLVLHTPLLSENLKYSSINCWTKKIKNKN